MYTGTGILTYTFLQPSYDSVNCMLEPDPEFNGGLIYTYGVNCNCDLTKFNYSTKTWNCTWDVNSLS